MSRKHLDRWVKLSAFKAFEDRNTTDSSFAHLNNGDKVPIIFSGMNRSNIELPTRMEIRLDGPSKRELTRNHFRIDLEINIVILTTKFDSDPFLYDRVKGIASAMFADFGVYKFGSGPDDDQSFLFCMQLRADFDKAVEAVDFGEPDEKTTKQYMGAVMGTFRGYVDME